MKSTKVHEKICESTIIFTVRDYVENRVQIQAIRQIGRHSFDHVRTQVYTRIQNQVRRLVWLEVLARFVNV